MQVTKHQLWYYAYEFTSYTKEGRQQVYADLDAEEKERNGIKQEVFDFLQQQDIRVIAIGKNMSEEHLGGDDIIRIADKILAIVDFQTQHPSHKVITYYGDDAEVLIAAVPFDFLCHLLDQ